MNASYKLALIVALVVCAFVVGYYAFQDDGDAVGTVEPEGPTVAQHEGHGPTDREAAAPLERPRLGDADRRPPQRRTREASREQAPRGQAQAADEPTDDFMTELRRRQAEARRSQEPSEPTEEAGATDTTAPPSPADRFAPSEADRVVRDEVDASEAATLESDRTASEPLADARQLDVNPSLTIGEPRPAASESTLDPEPVDAADEVDQPQIATSQASAEPDAAQESRETQVAATEPEPVQAASAPEPAPTSAASEPDTPRVPATYTIESGDTFSSLAIRFYDSERHWRAIAQANPTVDPARLRVGQEIRLPDPGNLSAASTDDSDETLIYTVRSHDTLGSIARQHYGSSDKWRVIYDANRQQIGDNPDRIREGMRLRVPPAPQGAE